MIRAKGGSYETDIRVIHAAARALALDGDTRRAIYRRATGCDSIVAMTDAQVKAVAAEFRRLTPAKPGRSAAKVGARKAAFSPSPKAHVRLVYALWRRLAEAGLVAQEAGTRAERRRALNRFINARFEGHLNGLQTDVDFLSAALAGKVAEALKAMAARAGLALEARG